MAEVKKIDEVISEINSGSGRFSKKDVDMLFTAIANDPKFTDKVVKKFKDGKIEYEEIPVTEEFRKYIKKLVEKLGIDKKESEIILSPDFVFPNMTGLYDFFAAGLYQYLMAGAKFDLPSHDTMKGSIYLKDVVAKTKQIEARNPSTGESLGTYESKTKAYKQLAVKSSCPKWLSEKRKIK